MSYVLSINVNLTFFIGGVVGSNNNQSGGLFGNKPATSTLGLGGTFGQNTNAPSFGIGSSAKLD